MLAAGSPVRGDNGLVGKDGRKLAVVIGDMIGPQQGTLAVDWHRKAIGSIGTTIVQKAILHT